MPHFLATHFGDKCFNFSDLLENIELGGVLYGFTIWDRSM